MKTKSDIFRYLTFQAVGTGQKFKNLRIFKMKNIIFKTLSDNLFTDRTDWLDYLYKMGTDLGNGVPMMSTAIVGLRRLGKTELFKRGYNNLFFG